MAETTDTQTEAPRPDPALARLQRLVGRWKLSGRPLGKSEDTIKGTTAFRWLHGKDGPSFFLLQEMELDYEGTMIRSHELIGYDEKTKQFSSFVFSNMAPDPWPYRWTVDGDKLTISIKYGPMDARYTGTFSPDGSSFSGGWRPSPGADQTANAPYDVVATRIT